MPRGNTKDKHPQAEAWESAAKKYMYNTFSVKSAQQDEAVGDDGKSISQWVTTTNAHDDFTVENHGLIHVGYLKNSAAMLTENALHWTMTGTQLPQASSHYLPEVFDILCGCMNWDGAAIYFGGNDWRIYATQCSDIIIYSLLRQLQGNRNAGYLEDVAIKKMRERQIAEGGQFASRSGVRRSMCVSIDFLLLRARRYRSICRSCRRR